MLEPELLSLAKCLKHPHMVPAETNYQPCGIPTAPISVPAVFPQHLFPFLQISCGIHWISAIPISAQTCNIHYCTLLSTSLIQRRVYDLVKLLCITEFQSITNRIYIKCSTTSLMGFCQVILGKLYLSLSLSILMSYSSQVLLCLTSCPSSAIARVLGARGRDNEVHSPTFFGGGGRWGGTWGLKVKCCE